MILHGNPYSIKPQIFFFVVSNLLHIFAGYNLLHETTPKICKMPLMVGYNFIKEPKSKEFKKFLIVGSNLIKAYP